MIITKQQAIDNYKKVSPEYTDLVERISEWLQEQAGRLSSAGMITYFIAEENYHDFYLLLKQDFELAGWRISANNCNDGTYILRFE